MFDKVEIANQFNTTPTVIMRDNDGYFTDTIGLAIFMNGSLNDSDVSANQDNG